VLLDLQRPDARSRDRSGLKASSSAASEATTLPWDSHYHPKG
jgi:hypothetical protein